MKQRLIHRTVLGVLLLVLIGAAFVLWLRPRSSTSAALERDVYILLFGSHPLLVSVAEGVEKGVTQPPETGSSEISWNITLLDANFNTVEAAALAQQAFGQKPDAIVALGTPMIKAAFAHHDGITPLFFGAASDPVGLGLTSFHDPAVWNQPDGLEPPAHTFGLISAFDYQRMAHFAATLKRLLGPIAADWDAVGYPINDQESNSVVAADQLELQLQRYDLRLVRAPVASPADVGLAARHLLSRGVRLIQVGPDNTVVGGLGSILAVAEGGDLIVLASDMESVREGAIGAVAINFARLGEVLGAALTTHARNPASLPLGSARVFTDSKLYLNPDVIEETLSPSASAELVTEFQSLGFEVQYVNDSDVQPSH